MCAGRIWRKEWKRKSWTTFKPKNAKERPSEVKVPKQAGGVNGRRRDEAAAENGDYETSVKENQIKRKNGRYKQMVGL